MGDFVSTATMIPALPCADVDRTAAFWTGLGLELTYRQLRPNPYVVVERGGLLLHYYGLPGLEPDANHSTCLVLVDDTAPAHAHFAECFRATGGKVPVAGLPRMTRPRKRANNAGLSGFSLVDPDGNWIRFSRRPPSETVVPGPVGERGAWVSEGGGHLARAIENAVVMADSHGDVAQARKALVGATVRHPDAPASDRAAAWSYLAELLVRLGDRDGLDRARDELVTLAEEPALTAEEGAMVTEALREIDALDAEVGPSVTTGVDDSVNHTPHQPGATPRR